MNRNEYEKLYNHVWIMSGPKEAAKIHNDYFDQFVFPDLVEYIRDNKDVSIVVLANMVKNESLYMLLNANFTKIELRQMDDNSLQNILSYVRGL